MRLSWPAFKAEPDLEAREAAATEASLISLRRRAELVLEQDARLVERVQRNMDRPNEAGIRTRFTPYWESNVQRFQQSVVAVLRRD